MTSICAAASRRASAGSRWATRRPWRSIAAATAISAIRVTSEAAASRRRSSSTTHAPTASPPREKSSIVRTRITPSDRLPLRSGQATSAEASGERLVHPSCRSARRSRDPEGDGKEQRSFAETISSAAAARRRTRPRQRRRARTSRSLASTETSRMIVTGPSFTSSTCISRTEDAGLDGRRPARGASRQKSSYSGSADLGTRRVRERRPVALRRVGDERELADDEGARRRRRGASGRTCPSSPSKMRRRAILPARRSASASVSPVGDAEQDEQARADLTAGRRASARDALDDGPQLVELLDPRLVVASLPGRSEFASL